MELRPGDEDQGGGNYTIDPSNYTDDELRALGCSEDCITSSRSMNIGIGIGPHADSAMNDLHKYMRERERVFKEDITFMAAKLYHELYPRSNFYSKPIEMQRQYENTVRKLYEIGNSRDLLEG